MLYFCCVFIVDRRAVTSAVTLQKLARGFITRCRAGREVAAARAKVTLDTTCKDVLDPTEYIRSTVHQSVIAQLHASSHSISPTVLLEYSVIKVCSECCCCVLDDDAECLHHSAP